MGDDERPESKIKYVVVDKPTENGVRLNNILTGLLLAAAVWVGSSVENLKTTVVEITTDQSHVQKDIGVLEEGVATNTHRIDTLEKLHSDYFIGR